MHTRSFFWWNTGQRNPFYCCPGWLDCRWVKGNLTGNSPVTHWHYIQKERSSHYGNAASGCKHSHAACSMSNHHHLLSLPELSRWLGFRLHAGHNSLSHHLFKQAQNWSVWTRPLWGWQSDNRTGSLTTEHLQQAHPLHSNLRSQSWAMTSAPSSELVNPNSATVGLAVWQQDWQSDSRTSAAGTSTTQPPASVLSHSLFEPLSSSELVDQNSATVGLAVRQQDWQSDNRSGSLTAECLQQAHPLHNNLQPQFWPVETHSQKFWGGSLGDLQCKGAFIWRSSIFIIGVVTKKKKEGKFSSTVPVKLDLSAGLMSLWGFDESTPVYSLPYEPLWVWWWWWVDA